MTVALLRILLFVPIVVGLLGLVVISIRDWDDWVFLGVLAMGLVGLLLTLDESHYPAPWKKRGFTRDSGVGRGSASVDEDAGESMLGTIVVGTDGSQAASRAVEVALDLAERYGARLVVGSSYRPVSETRVLRSRMRRPRTSSGRSTRPRTSRPSSAPSRNARRSAGSRPRATRAWAVRRRCCARLRPSTRPTSSSSAARGCSGECSGVCRTRCRTRRRARCGS